MSFFQGMIINLLFLGVLRELEIRLVIMKDGMVGTIYFKAYKIPTRKLSDN